MVVPNNPFCTNTDKYDKQDGMFQGGDYTHKSIGSLRISSHNYCGITTNNYQQCLFDMEHLQIDLQGFAEINLNTNQIAVKSKSVNIRILGVSLY